MALLRYLFVTGWAVWLGSIVFFSFVIAPTAFAALGRDGAAPLMRALFPRYYLVGLASGTVMLVTALVLQAELTITVPLVVALVLVAYARQVVTPSVNRAREAHDEQRFARLHRQSVQLNLIVLCLLLLVGSVVARLARDA